MSRHVGVSHSVRVLLYIFWMEFLLSSGWVTLHLFLEVSFLNSFASPYEDSKEKFAQIRGLDNALPIMVGREASPYSIFLRPLILSSSCGWTHMSSLPWTMR